MVEQVKKRLFAKCNAWSDYCNSEREGTGMVGTGATGCPLRQETFFQNCKEIIGALEPREPNIAEWFV
jgi:hypothetical protein